MGSEKFDEFHKATQSASSKSIDSSVMKVFISLPYIAHVICWIVI